MRDARPMLQIEVPPPEWYDHVVASEPQPEPEPRGVVIIPLLDNENDEEKPQ